MMRTYLLTEPELRQIRALLASSYVRMGDETALPAYSRSRLVLAKAKGELSRMMKKIDRKLTKPIG